MSEHTTAAERAAMRERVYVIECLDCRGDGILGYTMFHTPIACETCGGHEDAAGTGNLGRTTDVPRLLDDIDALLAALREIRDVAARRLAWGVTPSSVVLTDIEDIDVLAQKTLEEMGDGKAAE
jgi:ribosomal protein S27E